MKFTHWRGDAVSFAIQKSANLGEIAVPLHDVIQHGRLH